MMFPLLQQLKNYLLKTSFLLLLFTFSFSATKALDIAYTIQGSKFTCDISYVLTGKMPIKIKRVTNGKVDYLIIRNLKESDAEELKTLISDNRDFFNRFQAGVVASFCQPIRIVKKNIRSRRGRYFAVFYQVNETDKPRLIGYVGTHSHGAYNKKSNSVEGVYEFGHPSYTKVRGAGMVAIKAFFEHLIVNGTTRMLVLAMHKANTGSVNIAKKLDMHQDATTDEYHYWPYPYSQSEFVIFHLSAKEWRAKFFKKNVTIFSQSRKEASS